MARWISAKCNAHSHTVIDYTVSSSISSSRVFTFARYVMYARYLPVLTSARTVHSDIVIIVIFARAWRTSAKRTIYIESFLFVQLRDRIRRFAAEGDTRKGTQHRLRRQAFSSQRLGGR